MLSIIGTSFLFCFCFSITRVDSRKKTTTFRSRRRFFSHWFQVKDAAGVIHAVMTQKPQGWQGKLFVPENATEHISIVVSCVFFFRFRFAKIFLVNLGDTVSSTFPSVLLLLQSLQPYLQFEEASNAPPFGGLNRSNSFNQGFGARMSKKEVLCDVGTVNIWLSCLSLSPYLAPSGGGGGGFGAPPGPPGLNLCFVFFSE